ncbi:MAG: hypothetical protein ACRCTA_03545, partial [Bacilli bacterium]
LIAVSKTDKDSQDITRKVREIKNYVIDSPKNCEIFNSAASERVNSIMDAFAQNPILKASDIMVIANQDEEIKEQVDKLLDSTSSIINKNTSDAKRTKVTTKLENALNTVEKLDNDDFKGLKDSEYIDAKDLLSSIADASHKLRKKLIR